VAGPVVVAVAGSPALAVVAHSKVAGSLVATGLVSLISSGELVGTELRVVAVAGVHRVELGHSMAISSNRLAGHRYD